MKKFIPFMIAAAVAAPLYLSTPVEAQSLNDIQRLEEHVNEAKARGNWGAVQDLEVQLNRARLQYQRNNGMGEVNDRGYNNGYYTNGYYNNGTRGYYNHPGWNNNGSWNNRNNRNDRKRDRDRWRQQQPQRGYYDQWGRWRNY